MLQYCSAIARRGVEIERTPSIWNARSPRVAGAQQDVNLTTHIHTQTDIMGTKNIAISDEAYQMLKALKRSGESFTDVIERMTRRSAVLELAGIVSKTEATNVERRVKDIRKQSSERILRTTKWLK